MSVPPLTTVPSYPRSLWRAVLLELNTPTPPHKTGCKHNWELPDEPIAVSPHTPSQEARAVPFCWHLRPVPTARAAQGAQEGSWGFLQAHLFRSDLKPKHFQGLQQEVTLLLRALIRLKLLLLELWTAFSKRNDPTDWF